MSLLDVKHQAAAQRIIQSAFARERVPHAYVFHGPDGVGKETFARGFAQLLLCPSPVDHELEPADGEVIDSDSILIGCGVCDSCRLAAAGTHPDYHPVYRQLYRDHPDLEVRNRKGMVLGIGVIRHFLIERAGLKSAHGRGKVFIVREADRLQHEAQQALLKTLEEPPPGTFIILLVSALDQLLVTTQSRCQLVSFGSLPGAFVTSRLAALRPDCAADRCDWYARACAGSLGQALTWIDDELFELNHRLIGGLVEPRVDQLEAVVKEWIDASKSLGKAFRKRDPEMTDAEASRQGLKTVFQLAATWFDDIMRAGADHTSPPVNTAFAGQARTLSATVTPERAAEAIERIAVADDHLTRYLNTQLTVETLIGDLAHVLRGDSIRIH